MRIVIDMNLTPEWVGMIAQIGFEAVHWAQAGDPTAPDEDQGASTAAPRSRDRAPAIL